jgi:hypothetical protein
VVVASIDIVNFDQTAIVPAEGAALFTATNFTDALVVVPQLIATDSAVLTFYASTFYKDAASPSLIAPAIPSFGVAPAREMNLVTTWRRKRGSKAFACQ